MKFEFVKVIAVIACTAGCSHSSTGNFLTPDYLLAKGTQQITFLGDNEHPRFSPDGKRILFQSRDRGPHKGWQIYEIDLAKNKERRVTYSDGDAFDPTYLGDGEILYASTTDEIKESPFANKDFDREFPPADLYMSDLFGTDIVRVSPQPGYDAQPIFMLDEKRPAIFFSSRRGDLLGVYRIDLQKLPVTLVSAEKDKAKNFPALTPDKTQVAYVERDLQTKEESIVLLKLKGKVPRVLKSGEGQYRDLFFAPNTPTRLFYSILRKGEKYFQLEVYNVETQCTQLVFKGHDSLVSPAVSSQEPDKLAFARVFQGKKQIYTVNLPPDLGPCLETPAQVTLKK